MITEGPVYSAREAAERTARQIIDSGDLYLKAALAKSSFSTIDQLKELVREDNPIVSKVIAENQSTHEILFDLANDSEHRFDTSLANNRSLPEELAQKLWRTNVDIWLGTSEIEKHYGFEDAVNSINTIETLSRLQANKIGEVTSYRNSEIFCVEAVNEVIETAYNLIRRDVADEETLIAIASNGLLADASFYIRETAFNAISAKTIIANTNTWRGLIDYLQIAQAEDSDTLKNLLIQAEVFTEKEFLALPEDMLYKVMNWDWMI